MTNEEAINVLTLHKEHWERLIREHIAEKQEGEETVEALGKAIKALEEVEEWHSFKVICANEGIIVLKKKEADNETDN